VQTRVTIVTWANAGSIAHQGCTFGLYYGEPFGPHATYAYRPAATPIRTLFDRPASTTRNLPPDNVLTQSFANRTIVLHRAATTFDYNLEPFSLARRNSTLREKTDLVQPPTRIGCPVPER